MILLDIAENEDTHGSIRVRAALGALAYLDPQKNGGAQAEAPAGFDRDAVSQVTRRIRGLFAIEEIVNVQP